MAHVGEFESVISQEERKSKDGAKREAEGDQDDRFRKLGFIARVIVLEVLLLSL